jgi:hypothetical protein
MAYIEETRLPGGWLLSAGVIFPAAVVLFELVTGLCANVLFDPLPTWRHVLIVLAVPVINLVLWRAARREEPGSRRLLVAAGASMAISGLYALIMLPLMPIALIGILFLGLGLMGFAPALALIATLKLTGRLVEGPGSAWRRCFAGIALGVAAISVADLPATATHLALRWSADDDASARRGVTLMRWAGDEAMLLRLSYGDDGRSAGLVSFLLSSWNDFAERPISTGGAARELYYRATGHSFNEVPAPGRPSGRDGWLGGFDADRGGTAVGGREHGLRLDSSRIDGSVAVQDNVAYLEWTAIFANATDMPREARLTYALPPGAVASRATLWVNGEPREASIAGRGQARAAYENVVSARRDPLLVTTDGAGRLLVQAFPVQPRESLKLRIGVTAPFEIAPNGARSVALPAIVERNFDLPPGLRHQVWIEGDGPIGGSPAWLTARRLASGSIQLRGSIDDKRLAAERPRIQASRVGAAWSRSSNVPAKDKQPGLTIVQTIAPESVARPSGLTILLDGSAANRAAAEGLEKALAALPAGLPVGLLIASDEPLSVPIEPWSHAQRERFEKAIGEATFGGGQDNVGALATALDGAGGPGAALLWVHGPQPVDFVGSRARLDQVLERRAGLPRLIRYQAVPGRQFAIAGNRWFEAARDRPPSGDAARDLKALLTELGGGNAWRVRRAETGADIGGGGASSVHVARLWAAERIAAAADALGDERSKAIELAYRLNIVTPVSGAVVLETDQEYKANGLAVPRAGDVPTVPEPEEWAMLAIVLGLLSWLYRRRIRRVVAGLALVFQPSRRGYAFAS